MGVGLVLRSGTGNAAEAAGSTGINCGGILCGFGGRTFAALLDRDLILGGATGAGSTGINSGGIMSGFGGRTPSTMIGSRTAFFSFSYAQRILTLTFPFFRVFCLTCGCFASELVERQSILHH